MREIRQVSQFRRDRPCQFIAAYDKALQVEHFSHFRGNCSIQFIGVKIQDFQLEELCKGNRNWARQTVAVQIQFLQFGESAKFRWNCSFESIYSEAQRPESGKVSNLRWNAAGNASKWKVNSMNAQGRTPEPYSLPLLDGGPRVPIQLCIACEGIPYVKKYCAVLDKQGVVLWAGDGNAVGTRMAGEEYCCIRNFGIS